MNKGSILIVDDAAFIREVLGHLLTKEGYTVVGEAVDGEEAVKLAGELRPDLIIMDIVMPKMSGIEATKAILQEFPEQRIVACSTEDSEGMVGKAVEAGCLEFITKPFTRDSVVGVLEAVFEEKGGNNG